MPDNEAISELWLMITVTRVHVSKWKNIKPTNKPVTFSGINLDKIINGKIVEHGETVNMFEALIEMGTVKIAN